MAFQYKSLGNGEIRLCRLLETPQDHNSSLQLELKHFSSQGLGLDKEEPNGGLALAERFWSAVSVRHFKASGIDSAPPYTALSYTWGEEAPLFDVLVNNAIFRIRTNLRSFLLAGLNSQNKSWLWIDQICINQSDVQERNQVVKQMALIYSSAQHVCVYLGDRNEHTDTAFRIFARENELWYKIRTEDVDIQELYKQSSEAVRCSDASIRHFLGRPYWTRQWVIQEMMMAKSIILQCGTNRLFPFTPTKPYDKVPPEVVFRQCISRCLNHFVKQQPQALQIEESTGPESIYKLWHNVASYTRGGYSHHLKGVLHTFSGECFDPRDQVYALNSLVQEDQRVVVDYNLTTVEVFWATLRRLTEFIPYYESLKETAFVLVGRMGLGGVVGEEQIVKFWRDTRSRGSGHQIIENLFP